MSDKIWDQGLKFQGIRNSQNKIAISLFGDEVQYQIFIVPQNLPHDVSCLLPNFKNHTFGKIY